MDFPFLSHWPSCAATSSDRRVPHGGVTARRLPALCRAGPRAFARHRRAAGPRPHAAQTPPDALTLRSARDGRPPGSRDEGRSKQPEPGAPGNTREPWQGTCPSSRCRTWPAPPWCGGPPGPGGGLPGRRRAWDSSGRSRLDATPDMPAARVRVPGRAPRGGREAGRSAGRSPQHDLASSSAHQQETQLSSKPFWSRTQVSYAWGRVSSTLLSTLSVPAGRRLVGGGWGASHPSPQSLTPAPEPGPVRTSSFSLLAAKRSPSTSADSRALQSQCREAGCPSPIRHLPSVTPH